MNIHLSYLMATDAILYCRGKELENSNEFDMDKLIQWFLMNIKTLRQIKYNDISDD